MRWLVSSALARGVVFVVASTVAASMVVASTVGWVETVEAQLPDTSPAPSGAPAQSGAPSRPRTRRLGASRRGRIPINLESRPPGAVVYADADHVNRLGETPIRDLMVQPGAHNFFFVFDNHWEEPLSVVAYTPGETFTALMLPQSLPQDDGSARPLVPTPQEDVGQPDNSLLAPPVGQPPEPDEAESAPGLHWATGGFFRLRGAYISAVPVPSGEVRDDAIDTLFTFGTLRLGTTATYRPEVGVWSAAATAQIDFSRNAVQGARGTTATGDDVPLVDLPVAYVALNTKGASLYLGRFFILDAGFGTSLNPGHRATSDWGDPMSTLSWEQVGASIEPLKLFGVSSERHQITLMGSVGQGYSDPAYDGWHPLSLPATGGPRLSVVNSFAGYTLALGGPESADRLTIGGWYAYLEPFVDAGRILFGLIARLVLDGVELSLDVIQRAGRYATWSGDIVDNSGRSYAPTIAFRGDDWSASLSGAYLTGDPDPMDGSRSSFLGMGSAGTIGLVLFPVVVESRIALQWPEDPTLATGGRATNAHVIYPEVRLRFLEDWEVATMLMLAWADVSDASLSIDSPSCGLASGDCFLGWELDAGLHARWGDHGGLRWSTEAGFMMPGSAFHGRLQEGPYWTLQTRFAWVF